MNKTKPAQQRRRRKRRVKEPLTDELLDDLLNSPDPAQFMSRHKLTERSLSNYLQQLLDEKGLVRPEVVRAAGLDATYGYQIFMGQRHPKRDKLLQVTFAMGCTLQETNRALQASGNNELYCKNRRDAIIIFCLDHGYSLQQTDDELFRFGEDTIC